MKVALKLQKRFHVIDLPAGLFTTFLLRDGPRIHTLACVVYLPNKFENTVIETD